jgi:hypothetical protein
VEKPCCDTAAGNSYPQLLKHTITAQQQVVTDAVQAAISYPLPPCCHRLNAVVTEVATERAQRFQGRTLEVLVEGANPKDPKQVCQCM